MDWTAFALSLKLAGWTAALLLPIGLVASRALAFHARRSRPLFEAAVALPLVLPPTVLGYYLLVAFGGASPLGKLWTDLFGHGLAFSFHGLLAASVLINIPFAVQPMQRAFEALPADIREAAWVSGLTPWATFWRIELPLAWPGVLSAFVLTFAHTLGEFGVVLMVGGSIPGETRTAALAIYDRVQAFDNQAAGAMSLLLLLISIIAILIVHGLSCRIGRRRG
ncbi:molybdate ABC transporter permease subunit [Edaphosphingomonas haloaromaticamans]|uniref:Molybdenum transport system permease n=1 Tax=Edaphosphingomonas haloaromaticamans TaxID=653954 RepID=A0A1S1HGH8_9SPHN|nr:molybdate ABC transporter permease subunit [Sphingomonas haloaromaticamans]OHT19630.1 Molybdenum transport system permease protein ModB [Sphingomonas haloaromaticamans]